MCSKIKRMKSEQTQEEIATETKQREERDRMYDNSVDDQEPKIEGEPTQEDRELYTVLHYMVANGEDISNFAKELKGESTDKYVEMAGRLSEQQKHSILEIGQKIREATNSLQEIVDNK